MGLVPTPCRPARPCAGAALLAAALAAAAPATAPAADPGSGGAEIEMSPISGDREAPRRHFRLRHPERLTPERAREIYAIVRGALETGFRRSGVPAARTYQRWRRYNSAPYLSATHGNHYLNNYANETASAYGRFERAGTLPPGSIIAKDSFSVTETGGIVLGPLFLMEKMPDGFSYVSGDWKYSLVLPDGTLLGETNGAGAERVEYCIACHLAVEEQDHLYFVPETHRAAPGE